jgi:protein transport protein DSL1/ZW10
MSLSEATVALQAYKEVEKAMKQLWEDLDDAVLNPRTELRVGPLPQIQIDGVSYSQSVSGPPLMRFQNSIRVSQDLADNNIKALFIELENIIRFLIKTLTPELVKSLSDAMMPTLSTRVKELWLDTAVPASLGEIENYQKALDQVSDFANTLDVLGWPDSHGFHHWVEDAHKNWLNKRRETVLDWTRNQLELGKHIPIDRACSPGLEFSLKVKVLRRGRSRWSWTSLTYFLK